MPDMGDTAKFPLERVEAVAANVVAIIEREVGTSFIGRTVTQTYDGNGTTGIMLRQAHVQSVTSVEVDGVAVTDALTAPSGILRRKVSATSTYGTWPCGDANVEVVLESGYSDEPPADIKEVALKATRYELLASSATSAMDGRRTSLSTEMGTIQYSVAGTDRPTGYPDVDAVIVGWRNRIGVFGFA